MKKGATSKEDILRACRKIVARGSLKAVNMRTVAAECQIALGTLYNYYSNKDELLIATVESVWGDIFHGNENLLCNDKDSFPEYVNSIFLSLKKGMDEYPNFFVAHSASIATSQRGKAKSIMDQYFVHMKKGMETVLESDLNVNQACFSAAFTRGDFLDFIINHIILLLVEGKEDCRTLIEIIRKIIYAGNF